MNIENFIVNDDNSLVGINLDLFVKMLKSNLGKKFPEVKGKIILSGLEVFVYASSCKNYRELCNYAKDKLNFYVDDYGNTLVKVYKDRVTWDFSPATGYIISDSRLVRCGDAAYYVSSSKFDRVFTCLNVLFKCYVEKQEKLLEYCNDALFTSTKGKGFAQWHFVCRIGNSYRFIREFSEFLEDVLLHGDSSSNSYRCFRRAYNDGLAPLMALVGSNDGTEGIEYLESNLINRLSFCTNSLKDLCVVEATLCCKDIK